MFFVCVVAPLGTNVGCAHIPKGGEKMSRNNRLSYSRSGSSAIQSEFQQAVEPVKASCKSVTNTVETCQTWWKGGSSIRFVQLCNDVRQDIERELASWLESHQRLVNEIGNRKFAGDDSITFTRR